MKPEAFEAKMRRGEFFHTLRVPEGMWTVVRLDGRGFTKLTKELGFLKPFDEGFHTCMLDAAVSCMLEFQSIFSTTHSDEISLLFPPSFDMFDREVEKIVSTTSAEASVAFSESIGFRGTFDSRIWIGTGLKDVEDYFCWRMEDAVRGAINSYAYWLLRQQKDYTQRQATRELLNKNFAWKNEFLFKEFGINFNEIPAWQRRGTGVYWKLIEKTGHNPLTNEDVTTLRRVLHHEENLPMKEDFRDFLHANLAKIDQYPSETRGAFLQSVELWRDDTTS